MYGPEPKQPKKKQQFPSQLQPSWFAQLLGHHNTSVAVWHFCPGKRVVPFLLSSASGSPPGVTSSAVSRSRQKSWREGTHYAGTVQAGSEMEVKPQKKTGTKYC